MKTQELLITKPISIGTQALRSRLFMPPMATAKASGDGLVGKDILEYYHMRTKASQLGLVVIEHAYVMLQGKAGASQISVSSDDTIEGLRSLAQTIHGNGPKCLMQLNHAGNAANTAVTGMPVVGPSVLTHPGTKLTCEELSETQIEEIIESFRLSALRAQKAGFDGVEIHAAHGYLLNQFYTPKANHRTDQYGGSLVNRIRIHLEIIQRIKASVNPDFIVSIRFGACDYSASGGATIADGVEAAMLFEKAGVDAINVSGGVRGYIHPNSTEPGWFKDASSAIKNALSIPVLLAGGVTKLAQAETLLQEGCADMIGVGRSLLKDANWIANEFAND